MYDCHCGADTLLGLFGVRSTVVHEFGNGLCVIDSGLVEDTAGPLDG